MTQLANMRYVFAKLANSTGKLQEVVCNTQAFLDLVKEAATKYFFIFKCCCRSINNLLRISDWNHVDVTTLGMSETAPVFSKQK